ncbi:MAG: hypothetical protein HYY87_02850 [Candidatus Levybacteria bacterium]|nr:hypothetical protein [Candidatus Levybacteria bacterium]
MTSIDDLEKRVARIEGRNKNVELDKRWETSYTRRILLITLTYIAIGFYLSAIQIKEPWLNAIVPSFGFLLSTLTLPFFKNLWKKYFYKNE